jgi:hypothetical protein
MLRQVQLHLTEALPALEGEVLPDRSAASRAERVLLFRLFLRLRVLLFFCPLDHHKCTGDGKFVDWRSSSRGGRH